MFKFAVLCMLTLLIKIPAFSQSKDCSDADFIKAADSLISQLVKLQARHDRLRFYTEKLSDSEPIDLHIQSIFPSYITAFEDFIAFHATVIEGNTDRCIRMYRCHDVSSTTYTEYTVGISPYGNVFFFNGFPSDNTLSALEFVCKTIRTEDDIQKMIRIYGEIWDRTFDSIATTPLANDSIRIEATSRESTECLRIEVVRGRIVLLENCLHTEEDTQSR